MLDQKAVFYTKLQVLSSSYLNLKNFQQRISFSQVLILNTRLIDAKFEFSLSNVSVGKVKRFSQHNYKVARLALNTTNILTATTTTKTTTCCSQFEKPLEFGLFVRFLALHILERERAEEAFSCCRRSSSSCCISETTIKIRIAPCKLALNLGGRKESLVGNIFIILPTSVQLEVCVFNMSNLR